MELKRDVSQTSTFVGNVDFQFNNSFFSEKQFYTPPHGEGDSMTISQETINGKWLEIKGEIQNTWGKLTSDEIEKTKGDIKSIAGLVLQKYGEDYDKVHSKYSEIVNAMIAKKEAVVANIKQELKS